MFVEQDMFKTKKVRKNRASEKQSKREDKFYLLGANERKRKSERVRARELRMAELWQLRGANQEQQIQ